MSSKCPFWSNGKSKVECDDKCVMNNFFGIDDNCPFKEYLSDSKINIKNIEEFDQNKNEENLDFVSQFTK